MHFSKIYREFGELFVWKELAYDEDALKFLVPAVFNKLEEQFPDIVTGDLYIEIKMRVAVPLKSCELGE